MAGFCSRIIDGAGTHAAGRAWVGNDQVVGAVAVHIAIAMIFAPLTFALAVWLKHVDRRRAKV